MIQVNVVATTQTTASTAAAQIRAKSFIVGDGFIVMCTYAATTTATAVYHTVIAASATANHLSAAHVNATSAAVSAIGDGTLFFEVDAFARVFAHYGVRYMRYLLLLLRWLLLMMLIEIVRGITYILTLA